MGSYEHRRAPAFLLVVTLAVPASRAADDSLFERAKRAYEAAHYDRALGLLERTVERATSDEVRIRAHELRATIHIILGEPESAEGAFVEILRLDSTYRPSELASPKLLAAYEAARVRHDASAVPALEQPALAPVVVPPPAPAPGDPSRWYQNPWLWGAVAVALAGGVTASVWATRIERPEGDLPPIELP